MACHVDSSARQLARALLYQGSYTTQFPPLKPCLTVVDCHIGTRVGTPHPHIPPFCNNDADIWAQLVGWPRWPARPPLIRLARITTPPSPQRCSTRRELGYHLHGWVIRTPPCGGTNGALHGLFWGHMRCGAAAAAKGRANELHGRVKGGTDGATRPCALFGVPNLLGLPVYHGGCFGPGTKMEAPQMVDLLGEDSHQSCSCGGACHDWGVGLLPRDLPN